MLNHRSLFALYNSEGYLCTHWWASSFSSAILFTDTKVAKTWIKKVNSRVDELRFPLYDKLSVVPQNIKEVPDDLKFTINPSIEAHDIDRIMKRAFWRSW